LIVENEKFKFDKEIIDPKLKSTQNISADWAKLNSEKGLLRITAGAALTSVSKQSLLGLPIKANHMTVSTKLIFNPEHERQSAGLVSFFDTGHWQYLSYAQVGKEKFIKVVICDNYEESSQVQMPLPTSNSTIELKLSIESEKILFYISTKQHQWHKIGQTLKISRGKISTSSLLGICCIDHFGRSCNADFEYLSYTTQ